MQNCDDARESTSVKRIARTAGALYLVIFIVAPFAFLIGRSQHPRAG